MTGVRGVVLPYRELGRVCLYTLCVDARSLIQPTTLGSVQGQDALGQLPAQALDTVARVYIINDRPQTACELGRRLLPRPGWQSPGQATPDP